MGQFEVPVDTDTEKVTILQFGDLEYPSWYIPSAELSDGCGEDSRQFSGYVDVSSGTEIEFTSVQPGILEISLQNYELPSAGMLRTLRNKVPLSHCAVFSVKVTDQSLVFPIEGIITIGSVIKEPSTEPIEDNPILLNGNIHLIDKYTFTDEFYTVGPFQLVKGDLFTVKSQITQSSGFIHMNIDKKLSVSYRAKALSGYIKRYKTDPIEVRNGMLTRLYNDYALVIMWIIMGFVYRYFQYLLRVKVKALQKGSLL